MGKSYSKNSHKMYDELFDLQPTAIDNADRLLQEYPKPNPAKDNPSTTVHLLVQQLNRFIWWEFWAIGFGEILGMVYGWHSGDRGFALGLGALLRLTHPTRFFFDVFANFLGIYLLLRNGGNWNIPNLGAWHNIRVWRGCCGCNCIDLWNHDRPESNVPNTVVAINFVRRVCTWIRWFRREDLNDRHISVWHRFWSIAIGLHNPNPPPASSKHNANDLAIKPSPRS